MTTNHVDVYVHCDVDGLPLDVYLTYAEASAAQAKWTRSSSVKRVPLVADAESMLITFNSGARSSAFVCDHCGADRPADYQKACRSCDRYPGEL